MHPLIGLLASQPQRLVEHVEAYGALAALEVRSASALWRTRALLVIAATVGLAIALALAGVALMLAAALPSAPMQAPWVLVLVPAVPVVLALASLLLLALRGEARAFENLRRQFQADLTMLREANEP
jgi:thiol:disulfide interchange protein